VTDARADAIVVGAGVIGLSIAYQLARRGAFRVTVLEKAGAVAEGSTGSSSAVLRQRYSNPEMIRLARDGLRAYTHWPEFTGLRRPRAARQRNGMVWMTNESAEQVAAHAERMRGEDVDVAVLDAAELRERFPALSACGTPLDLEGEDEHACGESGPFLFEKEAGYFDPVGACQDLAEASQREGVEVRLRQHVAGVRSSGGRVQGVTLTDGTGIDAPVVVNAAGPWCNALNRIAGLELPWTLRPTRAQIVLRERSPEVSLPLPIVADGSGGLYFRPEARDQQILIGSIRAEDELEGVPDPDAFDRSVDAEFRDAKLLGLHHRLAALPHKGRVSGLAGLYTVNEEDVHPIVGPTSLEGFFVANGFSGHGFKLAPMVGSLVAQAVTGKRVDFDTDMPIGFLGVDRAPIDVQAKTVLA
jgi:glycine/D-amino acid oxidase-like deaminating enzyme